MEGLVEEYQWSHLPYPALINIFSYLDFKDVVAASGMCCSWFEASRYELLWKKFFYGHFRIDRNVKKIAGTSWYDEYKRLYYHIPVVKTEVLTEHSDQVLHVSFSHNGEYFATCSKDGYIFLWTSDYPATLKYSENMKRFSWKYTQFSQFNESDTLLLVSGVHFGTPHSTSGEIAVFNLQEGFQLQCRVVNKPYDIFGTWYSDQYLLAGELHWLAHLVSCSFLWLNKASQEAESEWVPITHCLYKFYNRNASSVRAIMIANCLPNSENAPQENEKVSRESSPGKSIANREHGNPLSHRVVHTTRNCINMEVENDKFVYPICYNSDYRRVESEVLVGEEQTDEIVDDDGSEVSYDGGKTDKYLIFLTGFKTYTPHQVGFKRIKPFVFPERLDPGPSLKERLVLHNQKKEKMKAGSPPPDPDWLNYENVADRFDKVDHLIDLHGHIVGMALSPDHRYLYVNSRSWPTNYKITNPLDPPPIAQEIDIHVIDLVTLKEVGTMHRAHKAYTPNYECFFIFLDVCNEYVASGAEDKHGYLWDRHYGVCLAKFPHDDVVNSVAFNSKDSEMLVSTSDDHKIKIWRSRSKVKELGLKNEKCEKANEMRTRAMLSLFPSRKYCILKNICEP